MKRTNERIDRKTAGRGGVLAGFVFAFLTLFLVGAVTETGAQPLVDLMNNQLNKLKNQDVPKPGVEVSCSLVVSPSHGMAGANVVIHATATSRERALAGAELTLSIWEPELSIRVHDVTGRFSAGGIFETSWTVPARTDGTVRGFDVRLLIPNREGGTACVAHRPFWYDTLPVISLDCGDPLWQPDKSYRVTADVKREADYTFTWLVDGNKGKEQAGRRSSSETTVGPFSEGTHTVKVIVSGPFGTSEAECSRKVEVKHPRLIIKSATSKLGINESGEWCVQWEAYTDGSNTLTMSIPDAGHEETRTVSKEGTGCFRYTFTKTGYFAVNLRIQNGGRHSSVATGVSVHACPEGKKECRGGCIDLTDVCCQTGPPGSCVQGQQCCGNVCCGGGEVCDATNNACCPAGSTFIAGKGICCPGNAPDVCGDKCMPSGATCCTSYHCAGAANHVCCNDGRCCPSGNICCADGGCCPAGRVCSANGGCSCPADKPTPCGPNCCASGQICRDNQCVAACLPPTCCAESPVVCSSHCCPAGSTCTPTGCSTPTVCPPDNPQLCGSMCVPAGSDCCGGGMACLPGNKCCGDHCCPTGSPCCGAGCCQGGTLCCPGATACCPQLSQCCGSGCCPTGTTCCGAGCCPAGTVCQNGGCVQASSSIQSIQSLQAPGIAPASSPLIYTGGQAAPANTLPLLLK